MTHPDSFDARGTLEVGQQADIVVFDAATVRDAANYTDPTLPAEGIAAVIVNGALTWRDDDRSQRVVVEPGPANDAVAVGMEAVDAAAFYATVDRLQALGAEVVEGTD